MKIERTGGLLSLTASVMKHYGVETPHRTLPEMDGLLAKDPRNVVVMLFDGLGTAILEKHLPPDAFLRKHLVRAITSVFPPTTTAAETTMRSGLSPIEHGWLGWGLYFGEIGGVVNLFPNTLSGGGKAADYHVAYRYIPYKTIFEKIAEATDGETKAYYVSPYSDFHSQSVVEICDTVESLCGEPGRKYIYTYWHQPDYDMHNYGTAHKRITAHAEEINARVEELCAFLGDTLVIVTADHGLIDTEWRSLTDHPDVTECLAMAPSIESRATTFFVKDGMHGQFESAFRRHFGDIYSLYTKREVLEGKFFGEGAAHPRAEGFVGDYLAIAEGGVSIANEPIHGGLFKAGHAGLSDDEVNVPLIAIECGKQSLSGK